MFEITSTVSTKGRYHSTLPLTLMSIAQQTVTPKRLIIFDDNEKPLDLREDSLYQYIFKTLDRNGIKWEVVFGEHAGQVANHQRALDMCETEFIHRIDDDEVMEPDVLEALLSVVNEKTGAVGGCVIDPKQMPFSTLASNKIEDIYLGINEQWFKSDHREIVRKAQEQGISGGGAVRNPIKEVDHLYSSFIYRRSVAKQIGGYCMELSPKGFREETIFTFSLHKAGWKNLFNPNAVTLHFRNPSGGIRA